MGFTFEMFGSDAEIFVKDLISYTIKHCGCCVGYVRDPLFDGLRFMRPYFIISKASYRCFSDIAAEEDNGTFSVTYKQWQAFEDKEKPHISYCATMDQAYKDVLVQHLSISSGLICDDAENEEKQLLEAVMLKYHKRYFYKAGRLKYKVYSLKKNK